MAQMDIVRTDYNLCTCGVFIARHRIVCDKCRGEIGRRIFAEKCAQKREITDAFRHHVYKTRSIVRIEGVQYQNKTVYRRKCERCDYFLTCPLRDFNTNQLCNWYVSYNCNKIERFFPIDRLLQRLAAYDMTLADLINSV